MLESRNAEVFGSSPCSSLNPQPHSPHQPKPDLRSMVYPTFCHFLSALSINFHQQYPQKGFDRLNKVSGVGFREVPGIEDAGLGRFGWPRGFKVHDFGSLGCKV